MKGLARRGATNKCVSVACVVCTVLVGGSAWVCKTCEKLRSVCERVSVLSVWRATPWMTVRASPGVVGEPWCCGRALVLFGAVPKGTVCFRTWGNNIHPSCRLGSTS